MYFCKQKSTNDSVSTYYLGCRLLVTGLLLKPGVNRFLDDYLSSLPVRLTSVAAADCAATARTSVDMTHITIPTTALHTLSHPKKFTLPGNSPGIHPILSASVCALNPIQIRG